VLGETTQIKGELSRELFEWSDPQFLHREKEDSSLARDNILHHGKSDGQYLLFPSAPAAIADALRASTKQETSTRTQTVT